MGIGRWAFLLVLVIGAMLRAADASSASLEWIETYEFIPGSLTLHWDHLPIRVSQHGALPVYLIRLSSELFGDSLLGTRMLAVVAGTATIALLYLIGARWWGMLAGVVAAGFLAIDRYHIAVSRAIDLPFDLFFGALTLYCFSRFLHGTRKDHREVSAVGRWLYGAAAATALGFLCKEFTALMIPVMFVGLIVTGRVAWLRRKEPWLALLLFAVLIAPDTYASLTTTPAQREDLLARHMDVLRQRGIDRIDSDVADNGLYMSYGDQLSRFHGIGFNLEPFYFYFGQLFDAAGIEHNNTFDEFPYMHPVSAIVLWAVVVAALFQSKKDDLSTFLLVAFLLLLIPFAMVRLGPPRAVFLTDSKALWYWIDRTMLPAMLLTGSAVSTLVSRWRASRSTTATEPLSPR